MSVSALLAAAAGAAATPNSDATALTCNLALPNGGHFSLAGRFDAEGLHSNLSDLIALEGTFAPAIADIVITSDGTDGHHWRLEDVGNSRKFDASLTSYGSDVAVLIIERQQFVGRHWGRDFVAMGYCDLRPSDAGEKES